MPIIDIPGQGLVEFPDSMTDDDIVAAIRRNTKQPVSAGERVAAVGTGANRGVAGLLGLPVDTVMNVADLAKAGAGTVQGAITGRAPSPIFDPSDRRQFVGSSEWIAGKMDKAPVTSTQLPRPDDEASRYLYAGGAALPAVATMRPTNLAQLGRAGTMSVAPTMAAQATAETFPDNPQAAIAASLLTAAAAQRGPDLTKNVMNRARASTLKQSQQEGLVVPPATTNPTLANRMLESWGGKTGTRQDAQLRNVEKIDRLAKREIGFDEGAELSKPALQQIRRDAGAQYEAIKNTGRPIVADEKYKASLAEMSGKYEKAAKAFPGLAKQEVSDLAKMLDQPEFGADAAIDATKILRERSSQFYSQGNKEVGAAYRRASTELEGLIERNLAGAVDRAKRTQDAVRLDMQRLQMKAQKLPEDVPLDDPRFKKIESEYAALKAELDGKATPQTQAMGVKEARAALTAFREARKTIAKTYSIEQALNESTGSVDARKFAQQLQRGKPLQGDLKKIAQFAQAFPKAAAPVTDSGSVRNTDMILGAGSAAMSGNLSLLLYPFTRQAARDLALSKVGQKSAIPRQLRDDYVPPLSSPEEQNLLMLLNAQQGLGAVAR